jgi:hypothetical protein
LRKRRIESPIHKINNDIACAFTALMKSSPKGFLARLSNFAADLAAILFAELVKGTEATG